MVVTSLVSAPFSGDGGPRASRGRPGPMPLGEDGGPCKGRRPMRAIVCTGYGPPDVLQLKIVPKPVPRDDEVLRQVGGEEKQEAGVVHGIELDGRGRIGADRHVPAERPASILR